jgi:general L-amino acid transport system permease protein
MAHSRPLTQRPAPKKAAYHWRSQAFRGRIYQGLLLLVLIGLTTLMLLNMKANMQARGIQSGFDFLLQPTGFDIGESLMNFDSAQPYWQAFLVGLSNTLRVAILGIVCSTALGTILGVGRFSKNFLLRSMCQCYVSVFRNISLLLQLLMWYILLTEFLPDANQAISLGNFYLSKGGLSFPKPIWNTGYLMTTVGTVIGVIIAMIFRGRSVRFFEATGHPKSRVIIPIIIVFGMTIVSWLMAGMPSQLDIPIIGDFAVEQGGALTPEFLSLLIGLSTYTAAFIAEVVRSGIGSVSKGQNEAARAIGLNRAQEMRLVVLPQALRVIIPPMTNQYLNLTKNSSLAVAIGYPEIVSIANTSINQTGRAVEAISIVMLVYLSTSLLTAFLMSQYNQRSAIKDR